MIPELELQRVVDVHTRLAFLDRTFLRVHLAKDPRVAPPDHLGHAGEVVALVPVFLECGSRR